MIHEYPPPHRRDVPANASARRRGGVPRHRRDIASDAGQAEPGSQGRVEARGARTRSAGRGAAFSLHAIEPTRSRRQRRVDGVGARNLISTQVGGQGAQAQRKREEDRHEAAKRPRAEALDARAATKKVRAPASFLRRLRDRPVRRPKSRRRSATPPPAPRARRRPTRARRPRARRPRGAAARPLPPVSPRLRHVAYLRVSFGEGSFVVVASMACVSGLLLRC